MKHAAAGLLLLSFGASAHRLDEYLQATTISIAKGRVHAELRLTPGVAVLPLVLAAIDTDGDGRISAPEQRAYAQRVLRDLSLAVDGDALQLQLISTAFPERDAMNEGLGEIQLDFAASIPSDHGERKLIFENRHQRPISAYLVNCLVPQDPDLRVTAQNRNYEQSQYRLDYVQAGSSSTWLAAFGIVLLVLLAFRSFAASRHSRSPRTGPSTHLARSRS